MYFYEASNSFNFQDIPRCIFMSLIQFSVGVLMFFSFQVIPRFHYLFYFDCRLVFKSDDLGRDILSIALPAALALTTDPIASLVDTTFIGQIGIFSH